MKLGRRARTNRNNKEILGYHYARKSDCNIQGSCPLFSAIVFRICLAASWKFWDGRKNPHHLQECTNAGVCTSSQVKLTLDTNWRWIHSTSGYKNCYAGNAWVTSICTDGATCAQQCALEGVTGEQYENTYGVEPLASNAAHAQVEHQVHRPLFVISTLTEVSYSLMLLLEI